MPWFTVTCRACGREFTAFRCVNRPAPIYCSRRCSPHALKRSVIGQCSECGREMAIHRHDLGLSHHFCSRECLAKWETGRTKKPIPWRQNHQTYTCQQCGREFAGHPCEHRKYCSRACVVAAHTGQGSCPERNTQVEKVCANCGSAFMVHHYRGEQSKYCSHACYRDAKGDHVLVQCFQCGRLFPVNPGRLRAEPRFCSRACHKEWTGPTDIEQMLMDVLESREVPFEREAKIGRWHADLMLRDRHVVIEADGGYWHAPQETQARDARKDADLAARGWTVFRFSEPEIRESPAKCVDKVLAYLAEHPA